jgi:hypothetical protein
VIENPPPQEKRWVIDHEGSEYFRFQDDTDLTFVIDSAPTFRADYSSWKDGEQMVLKSSPVVRREP